ncbi:MAG: threonine--tRNA ligase [Candidatus Pacearchaeota archaeon]
MNSQNSEDYKKLLKKISKVKMSSQRGKDNLKSNIELGRELDLYIVNEVIGHGLPLLTPRGTVIRREIERFITDEEISRGYLYTTTPVIAKADLFKISGHWEHFKEDMITFKIKNEDFALRPVTCPFHFVLYKRKPRSYKDLPLRYAEISNLFRNEQSGELRGLTRVRQFSLADAHIICTEEQLEDEFKNALELIKFSMKKLGIKDVWYRFSTWDSKNKGKYIDNDKAWESSQATMRSILNKLKIKFIEGVGEAAIYGPKLDFQYKDIYGKEDTLFTIQLDFSMPERFNLEYKDKHNEMKRAMVIHRSSVGALERVISVLLEQNQGRLKTWLSPEQVRIISFTEDSIKFCEKMIKILKEKIPGLRIGFDFKNSKIQGKIRDAEEMKIPYIILIGNKEEKTNTIPVRVKGDKKIQNFKFDEFVKKLDEEIRERK